MKVERAGQPQPFVADTLPTSSQEPTRTEVTFDHRKRSLARMTTTRVLRLGLVAGHLFGMRDPRRYMLLVADLTLFRIAADAQLRQWTARTVRFRRLVTKANSLTSVFNLARLVGILQLLPCGAVVAVRLGVVDESVLVEFGRLGTVLLLGRRQTLDIRLSDRNAGVFANGRIVRATTKFDG